MIQARCPRCGETFPSSRGLSLHRVRQHPFTTSDLKDIVVSHGQGETIRSIAARYGASDSAIYRYIRNNPLKENHEV